MFQKSLLLSVFLISIYSFAAIVIPLDDEPITLITQNSKKKFWYGQREILPIHHYAETVFITQTTQGKLKIIGQAKGTKSLFDLRISKTLLFKNAEPNPPFIVQVTFRATATPSVFGKSQPLWTDIRIYGPWPAMPDNVLELIKTCLADPPIFTWKEKFFCGSVSALILSAIIAAKSPHKSTAPQTGPTINPEQKQIQDKVHAPKEAEEEPNTDNYTIMTASERMSADTTDSTRSSRREASPIPNLSQNIIFHSMEDRPHGADADSVDQSLAKRAAMTLALKEQSPHCWALDTSFHNLLSQKQPLIAAWAESMIRDERMSPCNVLFINRSSLYQEHELDDDSLLNAWLIKIDKQLESIHEQSASTHWYIIILNDVNEPWHLSPHKALTNIIYQSQACSEIYESLDLYVELWLKKISPGPEDVRHNFLLDGGFCAVDGRETEIEERMDSFLTNHSYMLKPVVKYTGRLDEL